MTRASLQNLWVAATMLVGVSIAAQRIDRARADVRLMTLDPGHFHAALVQKEMYDGVAERVDVYAPVGSDLTEHLNRIVAFNTRPERPTTWTLEVHASPDYFQRMLLEHPGNVVVLSGRNRGKIGEILGSVKAGLHVLADKPWILNSGDLPVLAATLEEADKRGVVAYDIMTERFEVTNSLQRALVNDAPTFGEIVPGTIDQPAVYMESVHYLKKTVAGTPNIRPAWFFDTAEQGEGLNDVGTHLVDLAQWTLFPEQPVDYSADVHVLAAQRWPIWIAERDFRSVTNEAKFPERLAPLVKEGRLEYDCNALVSYTVRGIHTKLNVIWDWEPPPGSGDMHFASYRGTRARVEVRQTRADGFRPELYVVPVAGMRAQVIAAVQKKIEALRDAHQYPGIGVETRGTEIHITIPDALRVGHEAHFTQVTRNFLEYVRDGSTLPKWERPNMLAKYYVTTRGIDLSREGPPRPAPRIAPQ